eukprot:2836921-Rhodomonas_salina.5
MGSPVLTERMMVPGDTQVRGGFCQAAPRCLDHRRSPNYRARVPRVGCKWYPRGPMRGYLQKGSQGT